MSKSPAKCKEDINNLPRSSTPSRVNSSIFSSWYLPPINLFGSGRFGRKVDKDKDSEKVVASGVVDTSTIQHDTQERVCFLKLCLV